MKRWKVVVTDSEYEDLRYEKSLLNMDPIDLVSAQCRTEDEVIAVCHDADAIMNQYAPISRKVILALNNCKVITRYGVGVNTIDLDAATEKGICVANVPDYCADEVSDHALALMLSWLRKVTAANRAVKSGEWDYKMTQPIYRLRGRTLGLVGFGKIPRALAEKVKPLGLNVIAYDPYCPCEIAENGGVALLSLDELCREADIISVHAPLMASTEGMIGKRQFDLMKSEAIIINTSRGHVIDEAALIEALRNKRISGAALDVVEYEPIHWNNTLLTMDNVILTPHMAWYSEEAISELRLKAAMGVLDVLIDGAYPKYLVNKDVKKKSLLSECHSDKRYSSIVK
ncbi:C-terminal binding protein [Paenibacillus hamazuiensis]|uniref:C-terminal binding protein n=1 Tax=Paenibacillus hamazuiensis TaxID=2936508 RepID=UPI00200E6883|nr:C-terminal binding protein [Paenibacillus hamazuiensis]